MPKRKRLIKIPDYMGVPFDEDKLVVQKSNPLQTLSETKLTLPQFKILDAYLSRIDSHDERKRFVRFEKGELEKILNVTRISKEDLSCRLDNLFQVVNIQDNSKKNGFTKIALFEKAEAYQDVDSEQWIVDLACSPSAMKYIFNIENIGYLRYRLKNIMGLTSRYSYILYLYLENNRFRKSWKVDLKELKKKLNCTAKSYSKGYKEFNNKILKKCQNELHKKTDLKFSYKPTDKKGKFYTAVLFTLQTVSEKLLVDAKMNDFLFSQEQLSHDFTSNDNCETMEEISIEYGSELSNLLGNVACDNKFSPKQIRVIQDLVLQATGTFDHLELCNYLVQKMHKMNLYRPKKEFEYLCMMINNDIANN